MPLERNGEKPPRLWRNKEKNEKKKKKSRATCWANRDSDIRHKLTDNRLITVRSNGNYQLYEKRGANCTWSTRKNWDVKITTVTCRTSIKESGGDRLIATKNSRRRRRMKKEGREYSNVDSSAKFIHLPIREICHYSSADDFRSKK